MPAKISTENRELLLWLASHEPRSPNLDKVIELVEHNAQREASSPKLRRQLQEISNYEDILRDYFRQRCYANMPVHISRLKQVSGMSEYSVIERVEDIREHEVLLQLTEAKRLALNGTMYGNRAAFKQPYENAISIAFAKIPDHPLDQKKYDWILDAYKILDRHYDAALAAKRPSVA
jgi:hypothetical protein